MVFIPSVNMPQSSQPTALTVKIGQSMTQIDRHAWQALTHGLTPFLQYGFLHALEASASVGADSGWQPSHLTVYQADKLVAAMPLYLKTNSYGEYVFDWGWADAYRRHGERYYPKLLTAIPFTPSQSPRILCASDDLQQLAPVIVDAVTTFAQEQGMSSWHVLFPNDSSGDYLKTAGLIRRQGCQFHWFNRGYQSFDDFLQQCSSRKRKNLRKERDDVARQGFEFVTLTTDEIDEACWDTFYMFYQSTYQIRGQQGYLTRSFFSELQRELPGQVFLVMARLRGQTVAGALFLQDEQTLYGRYWGSLADFQNLHFETCYYQGIDYCIRHGLQRFDAGAQGEHKLRRGFEPIDTTSYHWIADERFRAAIADFCQQEALQVASYKQTASEHLPYRRQG